MSRSIVEEFALLGIPFDIPDTMYNPRECYVEFRVSDEDFEKAMEWSENFEHPYYCVTVSPGLKQ